MDERAQDCPTRMALGLGSGFVAGNLFGAISANWGDVPLVLRNKPLPALARTGSVMLQHGTALGLVGLAYSTVDVSLTQIEDRSQRGWGGGVYPPAMAPWRDALCVCSPASSPPRAVRGREHPGEEGLEERRAGGRRSGRRAGHPK